MNGGELVNMLTDGWVAIQGDALIELRKLEGAELSAVISDPPYASSGLSCPTGGTGQFLFLIPACKSKKVNKAKGRSWTHRNRGYHCVGQPTGGVHCAAGWRTT